MKNKSVWILMMFAVLVLAACGSEASKDETVSPLKEYSSQQFIMDTAISMNVFASSEQEANKALTAAFNEFKRIDSASDRFPDTAGSSVKSDVQAINASAGKRPVKVGKDVFNMVSDAIDFNRNISASFNITVGPVMDLYGFGEKQKHVPSESDLQQTLRLVGMENIIIDDKNQTVFLKRENMEIDLGGIAKGYATDAAAQKLRSCGIKHAVINAGGNVYAIGAKPDGSAWRIGIRDPRSDSGIIGVLAVKDEAVVSSGDYERFFIVVGKRYHHILDPQTGKPGDKSIATTIVCKSSTEADLLSTAVFLMGPQEGLAVCEKLKNAEAIVITPNKSVYLNHGIEKIIEFDGQQAGYAIKQ